MIYTDIPTTDLHRHRAAGARLIDIREPSEFYAGHIPGAVNLPLSVLVDRMAEVTARAVLICVSGERSALAARFLASQGKRGLMNLSGGTRGWTLDGHPLTSGGQP